VFATPPSVYGSRILWSACLSVRTYTCISVITRPSFTKFTALCCLQPCFAFSQAILRYIVYFRFCGWRHISHNARYGAGKADRALARSDSPDDSTDLTPWRILTLTRSQGGGTKPRAESDIYDCLVRVTFGNRTGRSLFDGESLVTTTSRTLSLSRATVQSDTWSSGIEKTVSTPSVQPRPRKRLLNLLLQIYYIHTVACCLHLSSQSEARGSYGGEGRARMGIRDRALRPENYWKYDVTSVDFGVPWQLSRA